METPVAQLTVQEKVQALAERAKQDYPESWRPDKDSPNPLSGEVVRYTCGPTANGDAPIVVIRDTAGKEWSAWLLHTALLAAFKRSRPQPGAVVFIQYEGKQTSSKTDREYHAYNVVAEGADDADGGVDILDAVAPAHDDADDHEDEQVAAEGDADATPF